MQPVNRLIFQTLAVVAAMGCGKCLAQVADRASASVSQQFAPSSAFATQGRVAGGMTAEEMGQPIDAAALDALRGGESNTEIDVRNLGQVDGNTADGVVSGNNIIQGGAFANASGLTTVIQNSGSNVLIQNGTAVNVQFVPVSP